MEYAEDGKRDFVVLYTFKGKHRCKVMRARYASVAMRDFVESHGSGCVPYAIGDPSSDDRKLWAVKPEQVTTYHVDYDEWLDA